MRVFKRGDKVEISSKDEGFEGSYYLANVISRISNKNYIVQYRTLLNEDQSGPLREVVSAPQIRLFPDHIPVTRFSVGDIVDAYDKDGWWVGKIKGVKGSNYAVYFKGSGEKIVYPLSLLRLHQD